MTRLYDSMAIFPIEVEKIEPHPQNPRKDLGDLSELIASIKQSGIMQNLTVVPQNDELTRFTCIIGHRRLAAAKKIGLLTVPCAIVSDMDEKEQVATMIAENMQRNDLTITEQASAVQLMLDFGEDFESIADRTGLSESTVRRRAKIAKFCTEIVTKAMKRGATLLDFEKIAEFENADHQKRLLDNVGTVNFANELKKIKDELKEKERLPEVVAELESKGFLPREKAPKDATLFWYGGIWDIKAKKIGIIEEFDTVRKKQPKDAVFYYTVKNKYGGTHIDLHFTSSQKDKAEAERREKDRAIFEKRDAVDELHNRFSTIWEEYITKICMKGRRGIAFGESILSDLIFDIVHGDDRIDWRVREQFDEQELKDKSAEIKTYYMIALQLAGHSCPMEWSSAKYEKKPSHERLRQLLEEDGYQESDEEKAFYDGTHEIWKGGEAE